MRQGPQDSLWEAIHAIRGKSIGVWHRSQGWPYKILWPNHMMTSEPAYPESDIVHIMVPAEAILTADIPVTPSASNITDIIIDMGIKGTITNTSLMGTVTDTSHHLDTITKISLMDSTSHRGDIIDIITMG